MTDQNVSVQLFNNYKQIKAYGQSPEVMNTFVQLLGRAAPHYVQSAITAVQANPKLQECSPQSIFRSALRAATLGLSCDPALGHAFIIPYRNKQGKSEAEFQAGWRGIQYMALRTGKYCYINVSPYYDGEEIIEDRITGGLSISGVATRPLKEKGLIASLKLVNGYQKSIYMTNEELEAHGAKYSRAYNRNDSIWKTNPRMAYHKTIVLKLIRTYGYLSPNEAAILDDEGEGEPEIVDTDLPAENEVTVVEGEAITVEEGAAMLGFEEDEVEAELEDIQKQPAAEPEAETEKEGFDWSQPVTIESASSVFSKSAGKLYCNMTIGELSQRFNALTKSLVLDDLTDEKRAEKEFKKKAAMTLIGAKKDGSVK